VVKWGLAVAGLAVAGPIGAVMAAGFFGTVLQDPKGKLENESRAQSVDEGKNVRAATDAHANSQETGSDYVLQHNAESSLSKQSHCGPSPETQLEEVLWVPSTCLTPKVEEDSAADTFPAWERRGEVDRADLEAAGLAVAGIAGEIAVLGFSLLGLGIEGLFELGTRTADEPESEVEASEPWFDSSDGYESDRLSSDDSGFNIIE